MDQEIKIQADPKDPERCVFTVDPPVHPDQSAFFDSAEKAAGSPLAESLFEVEGVRSVLIHHNLVTVQTKGTVDWYPVAKELGTRIRTAMASDVDPVSPSLLQDLPPEEEIRDKIQTLFDREVNPALMQHGGNVRLIDVKGNEVYIQLGGGCVGCGMVDVTLKGGIERAIRELVPFVGAIMDTTDHASGHNPYYSPSK